MDGWMDRGKLCYGWGFGSWVGGIFFFFLLARSEEED